MAVYTKISHQELEKLVSGYKIGTVQSFSAIESGVENSNYFLKTDIARFILTIYEKRVNHNDLPFFLKLMNGLAEQGIPCPVPISDKNGVVLKEIKNRPCALISFMPGGEAREINNIHIRELAICVAHMHLAGSDLPISRKNDLALPGWVNLFGLIRKRTEEFQPELVQEITLYLETLTNKWPSGLPGGIIHADIFPDNVFFDNDRLVGVIDFYFACNDLFMYDLAICLNAWCFEKNGSFNTEKARILFTSYSAIRTISQAEYEALPVLAMGAAMRFLLTRLYDWLNRVEDALVITKDPMEYLHKLRFHAGISSYRGYGL